MCEKEGGIGQSGTIRDGTSRQSNANTAGPKREISIRLNSEPDWSAFSTRIVSGLFPVVRVPPDLHTGEFVMMLDKNWYR